jgi:hypothetical protein
LSDVCFVIEVVRQVNAIPVCHLTDASAQAIWLVVVVVVVVLCLRIKAVAINPWGASIHPYRLPPVM